jgi:nucleoside 2-deoxyribosyltransferase
MRLYIAGPMGSKAPDYNFASFHAAAESLRAAGHSVINPAELEDTPARVLPPGMVWGERPTPHQRAWFLARDFRLLSGCDGIALLPDWDKSTGACCELTVALMLGLSAFILVNHGNLFDQSEYNWAAHKVPHPSELHWRYPVAPRVADHIDGLYS